MDDTSVLVEKATTVSDGNMALRETVGGILEVDIGGVEVCALGVKGSSTPATSLDSLTLFCPGTKIAPPIPTPRTNNATTAIRMCTERKRISPVTTPRRIALPARGRRACGSPRLPRSLGYLRPGTRSRAPTWRSSRSRGAAPPIEGASHAPR